jgi:hypothetical protein
MGGWEHGVIPNCVEDDVKDRVEKAIAVANSE